MTCSKSIKYEHEQNFMSLCITSTNICNNNNRFTIGIGYTTIL